MTYELIPSQSPAPGQCETSPPLLDNVKPVPRLVGEYVNARSLHLLPSLLKLYPPPQSVGIPITPSDVKPITPLYSLLIVS